MYLLRNYYIYVLLCIARAHIISENIIIMAITIIIIKFKHQIMSSKDHGQLWSKLDVGAQ